MFPTVLAQTETPAPPADTEVSDNAQGASESINEWLTPERVFELIQEYALPLVWAILILIATYIIAGIANRAVRNSLNKTKVDQTLARFFGKAAKYLVLTLGVIIALGQLGIEVTAFAAILAAAGFAVGMALSGTLGHFASGVMLLIFRPFKVGDYVKAGGESGTVYEIELFTTALDTPDKRRIIVPNGSIYGSTIENVSHHDTRRAEVAVGVDYSADIDKTREVLDAAAKSVEGVLSDPPHAIVLADLGDSAVNWKVRVWCNSSDYWAVMERTTRAIKMHLDDAGIGIPFPQMDVHMDKADG